MPEFNPNTGDYYAEPVEIVVPAPPPDFGYAQPPDFGYAQPPEELPCMNSTEECLEVLTEMAVQNSDELALLRERGALLEARIAGAKPKVGLSIAEFGLSVISLDPFRILREVLINEPRDRQLQIAQLETSLSELLAREETIRSDLRKMIRLNLLEGDRIQTQLLRLQSALRLHQTRVALIEIGYERGEGSTLEMMGLWQRSDELEEQRKIFGKSLAEIKLNLEEICGINKRTRL